VFNSASVLRALYNDAFYRASDGSMMAFKRSSNVILQSGFINLVEAYFVNYFRQSIQGAGRFFAEIHSNNLKRFKY
jgi:hypothetical protein